MRESPTLKQLNEAFGAEGAVVFREGRNGLPKVDLTSPGGWGAEVYLFGATVTAWATPRGENLLFLGKKAAFDGATPIIGGIPVIFPQFMNMGPCEFHGFARRLTWDVAAAARESNGDARVTLSLQDNEATRSVWPFAFRLQCEVRLGGALRCALRVANCGDAPFSFQTALHSYFAVGDVRRTTVEGLQGLEYWLNRQRDVRARQTDSSVEFREFTSRTYFDAPGPIILTDRASGREMRVSRENLPDVVVWTPWSAQTNFFSLMAEDEYQCVVAVEPGAIRNPILLKPGEEWEGGQTLAMAFV